MHERELAFAKKAARDASRILLRHYGRRLALTTKHGNPRDFATRADRESNAFLRRAFRRAYPDHNLLLEESGFEDHGSAYTWLADPLDGTWNYSRGFPFFSVAIALLHENKPVASAVYDPLRRELHEARLGAGAFLNGKRLHASRVNRLADATLGQNLSSYRERRDAWVRDMHAFMRRAHSIRALASMNLEIALVARGALDGFYAFQAHAWDVLPAALLVSEAGGRAECLDPAQRFTDRRSYVLSNGRVHASLKKLLKL